MNSPRPLPNSSHAVFEGVRFLRRDETAGVSCHLSGSGKDLSPVGSGRPGRGWLRLGLVVLVIAAVWMGCLPAVARDPRVESWLQGLQAAGVDPSARYYTELPMAGEMFRRNSAWSQEWARKNGGGSAR